MPQQLIVKPGDNVKLADYDPGYTGDHKDRNRAEQKIAEIQEQLSELQELLYAENKHALLIVLQAMDTGGKDGTIRRVMSGVNPQGCDVRSFKVPSSEEASYDYLWRAHRAVPPKGKIIIFNRSYYEDVLVVRVHDIFPKEVWSKRYNQINDFERMLVENGTLVMKFFLHISRDEQKERLEARLKEPRKLWKFSEADVRERAFWDDYMEAYEDALSKCSTKWAPWHIVPANRKWYRDLVVGESIVKALKNLDMKYPEATVDPASIKLD